MREVIYALSPPWLRRYFGERLQGTFGFFADLHLEACNDAVRAGFVKVATSPDDALALHGDNSNIAQVEGETPFNFRTRLAGKWTLWEESATTEFAHNVLAPFGVGESSVTLKTTRDWDPDGLAATNWSRFWIILEGSDLPWNELTWGSTQWGTPGQTWGTTATRGEIFGVLRDVCKWKSAHEVGIEIIILYQDADIWGHGHDWGDPGLVWADSNNVVRWPMVRRWGSNNAPSTWGTSTDPLRAEFSAVWGGKIRV